MELAYQGIEDKNYVFSNLQDNNFDDLGLMNRVASLSDGLGNKYSYNFLHTTLQEYLAAIYISQKSYLASSVQNDIVLTFYFGISSQLKNPNGTALNITYIHNDYTFSIASFMSFQNLTIQIHCNYSQTIQSWVYTLLDI